MESFLELMLLPFFACIILTGIHAYLGLHVIERQVIFVDLALSQLAAFGSTVAFLFGFHLHSTSAYFFALGFALLGALLFSVSRRRTAVVPQEALIGFVYAAAAAASILVLSRAPDGGEELKSLLVGHLLFVGHGEVVSLLLLYSAVGAVHYAARRPLLLISTNPDLAFERGMRVPWWDFLFYGTFAVVVTSSTELAGVLLVFSFLVVPAMCGVLLGSSMRSRLVIGWIAGAVTSSVGIAASYFLDLPTGAAIVCTFAVCLAICAALRPHLRARGHEREDAGVTR